MVTDRQLRLNSKDLKWPDFIALCAQRFSVKAEELDESLQFWAMALDGKAYWDGERDRGLEYAETSSALMGRPPRRGKQSSANGKAGPLSEVITIMRRQGNWFALDAMLEEDNDETHPNIHDVTRALERIFYVLTNRPKQRRGPRKKTELLFEFVFALADFWEKQTRNRFRQGWHNGFPTTKPGEFVYTVIHYIDPSAVKSLKKVMAKVVAQRKSSLPK